MAELAEAPPAAGGPREALVALGSTRARRPATGAEVGEGPHTDVAPLEANADLRDVAPSPTELSALIPDENTGEAALGLPLGPLASPPETDSEDGGEGPPSPATVLRTRLRSFANGSSKSMTTAVASRCSSPLPGAENCGRAACSMCVCVLLLFWSDTAEKRSRGKRAAKRANHP